LCRPACGAADGPGRRSGLHDSRAGTPWPRAPDNSRRRPPHRPQGLHRPPKPHWAVSHSRPTHGRGWAFDLRWVSPAATISARASHLAAGRSIMGLGSWIGGQFIDIIEWTEPSQNEILAHRFTRHKNEIKNGAKLIVREGQAAGFVKEGQLADVKLPGMYTLDTHNFPILSTILGWKYGFESPFKCHVYFISTRQW